MQRWRDVRQPPVGAAENGLVYIHVSCSFFLEVASKMP
jgi:hypothetical protein